jgi:nuclear-control-of-ATPase protein 2
MVSGSRRQCTYAAELLGQSLEVLSAIDVGIPEASVASVSPSDRVGTAAKELATSKPLTRAKLASILRSLQVAPEETRQAGFRPASPSHNVADNLLEADMMARAVTMAWKETMDVLMDHAQQMTRELEWWKSVSEKRRNVGLYFLQSEWYLIETLLRP